MKGIFISALIILGIYLAGYVFVRSHSFMYGDLDGKSHLCTIREFRNPGFFYAKYWDSLLSCYSPLVWLDFHVTGRELEDEM
jgi:hypothetical protein